MKSRNIKNSVIRWGIFFPLLLCILFIYETPTFANSGYEQIKISGTCIRLFPLSPQVDISYCRAIAWLNALKKATDCLPAFVSTRLWEMDFNVRLGKLALAALLFKPEQILGYSEMDSELIVVLKQNSKIDEQTLEILSNPILLSFVMLIIFETELIVEQIIAIWPNSLEKAWKNIPTIEKLSLTLDGLWDTMLYMANNNQQPFSIPANAIDIDDYKAKYSPSLSLVLASMRVDKAMFQKAFENIEATINLSEKIYAVKKDLKILWNIFNSHVYYLRGLANWRQNQLFLAEDDYKKALELLKLIEHEALGVHIFNGLGEILFLRKDQEGMCANFLKACAYGDCHNLAEKRRNGICIKN